MTERISRNKRQNNNAEASTGILRAIFNFNKNSTGDALINKVEYFGHKYVSESPVRRSEMDPGCFPGNALVSLADGKQTRLDSVTTGDKIITWDLHTGVMETKLISWLHSKQNSTMYFLEVQHDYGLFSATPDHLIYLYNGKAIYTGLLTVGAQLRYVAANGSVSATKVQTIRGYKDNGYYAPLTAEGTLLINGIYFSNFGVISKTIFGYIATSWARSESITSLFRSEFVEVFASKLFHAAEFFFPMLFF